jgi:hypothetical protein
MIDLLSIIKETHQLPIEQENISSNPTYTKNPHFSLLREMKRKGMIL